MVDVEGGSRWQMATALHIELRPGFTKYYPFWWYADATAEEYSGIERLKGECFVKSLSTQWVVPA